MRFNANVDILGTLSARNFSFQEDVLDIQADATLDPGVSPTTGARYLITDAAALHANFGTINKDMAGTTVVLASNDIVEYNGTEFRVAYDASAYGEGAKLWDRDSNVWLNYNPDSAGTGQGASGSKWFTEASAVSLAVADLSDTDIDAAAASDILMYNAAGEWSDAALGNGLKAVTTDGSESILVEPADIAGTGLEDDGADNLRIATSAAGNGLTGGGGSALAASPDTTSTTTTEANAVAVGANGISVKVDDSTLEGSLQGSAGAESLRIKSGGVDTTQMAADACDSTILDWADTGLRSDKVTWLNADGASKAITHSWGTKDIMVEIYDDDDDQTVFIDTITRTDTNTLTLVASAAPPTSYTVMFREIGDAKS